MHSSVWPKLFCNIHCSECGEQEIRAVISESMGLSSKISLKCRACSWVAEESHSSPRTESKPRSPYLVNQRMVNSIHSIGLGFGALERICSTMNLQCLNKSAFELQLKALHKEVSALKHNVLQRACQQVHEAHADVSSSNLLDIAVSYDDTWQKRGHESLDDVGIAIDIVTGEQK